MNNKIKKGILMALLAVIIIVVAFVIGLSSQKQSQNSKDKLKLVVSNFASYDFLRQIVGDNNNVEITFLLGPGKDTHSYDPSAGDIIKIQNSDLFVYIGGEMEKWAPKVIESLDNKDKKIICIADDVEKIEETEVDGAEAEEEEEEEEGAFDEHIWTSPKNAVSMVNALEKAMEELDEKNANTYKQNAENYIEKINNVDKQIQNVVDNKVHNRLIFGDKMPMQYFINYYNLKVSAAFNGCSSETEPSSKTIAYLVDTAKKDKIPVILYIELNDGRVAKTIANEVGSECKTMQIQTLHNVSQEDFKNGETWVSLMTRNIEVLKTALD